MVSPALAEEMVKAGSTPHVACSAVSISGLAVVHDVLMFV